LYENSLPEIGSMNLKILAPVALSVVLLGACENNVQNAPKQTLGSIMGAGVGALAGSQIGSGKGQLAAVAIGAIAGGLFGNEVGKSLDRADHAYMEQTSTRTLEYNRVGQSSSWNNPDSGHSGTITPTRTYQQAGLDCRDFETTVNIDGKTERATGRACRQADGTWRMQNS